ncbi:MAG: TRAP transporter large permease subunit [Deltaproteobacteria bacterium]|jgi:tripartite ATP-independent transporter DctM subunit|nr:TRAP transporter large permease subunit [Deltaproteobacteria bacterium]
MAEIILLAMFIALIIGIISNHPLGFVLGGVGIIAGLVGWGGASFNIIVNQAYAVMNNYLLIAIPMFVLMANFLMYSGVADGLFESVRLILGTLRGGLAVAVVLVATVFAATTGVVGASVLTMGLLAIPILDRYRYDRGLTAGVVCAGGSLGILIPPSIMLVSMASFAQISVGKLLLAAIMPGLLLSLCYMIYLIVVCQLKPEKGPAMSREELRQYSIGVRIKGCLINLVPPVILIIGVLGTIFTGVATPTEASACGAFLALILTICYRKFTFKMVRASLVDTAKTSCMCFVIMIGANSFCSIFMGLNGSQSVAAFVNSMGLSGGAVLIVMLALIFFMGCFIDWIGIVAICLPIFLPIMDLYDYDRLYVCAVAAVVMQTCFMTPPFGYALFYIKGIMPSDWSMMDIYKGVIPFLAIILIVVAMTLFFPQIILWLPSLSNL